VITGADDRSAGFLITDMVDGCVHVEQVSVDPGSARRGWAGRCLITLLSGRRPPVFPRSP